MSRSRSKSKPKNHHIPNPEIDLHPNDSSEASRETKLNAQILRVKSHEQLRRIGESWVMNEEELCHFFNNYQSVCNVISANNLFSEDGVKLVRTQNKIYFGQIKSKKKNGRGITIYREGKIYEGGYLNNEKHGYGCEIYSNGNMYLGEYNQNKKHGKGVFFWFSLCENSALKNTPNKVEQYEGTWWGGLPDGEGQHTKINGDFYLGQFKNGLKHGQGVEYYANSDKYKGQFINGLPEGYGEYVWEDGSNYKGDFKQGYRNGYGVWTSASPSNQSYKGHYMLDKKHGYGIYNWANGYLYKGNFVQDLRCGEGQLFYHQEMIYSGFWINGEKCQEQQYKTRNRKSKFATKLSKFDSQADKTTFHEGKNQDKSRSPKKNQKLKSQESFLVNFNHRQGCGRSCLACKKKAETRKSGEKKIIQSYSRQRK